MNPADEQNNSADVGDEPPPLLGSWRRVYMTILIYLVVLIVLFYIFGAVFTP